jgi:hypothetical protein
LLQNTNGKFKLEILFTSLVGSASGLIYKDNSLLIIGDNSGFLYEYQLDSKDLKTIHCSKILLKTPQKTSDFEAICKLWDSLYVLALGQPPIEQNDSTKRR